LTKSWLEEFNQDNGFSALQSIIIDYKTKYSILYNNNTGSTYFNSNNNANSSYFGAHQNQSSVYNNNEFKDKDTQLSKEIRFECIKILKIFVNTSVLLFAFKDNLCFSLIYI